MPGLVPGIHADERNERTQKNQYCASPFNETARVDGRDKPGHDGPGSLQPTPGSLRTHLRPFPFNNRNASRFSCAVSNFGLMRSACR
jgi:hypothetical protein